MHFLRKDVNYFALIRDRRCYRSTLTRFIYAKLPFMPQNFADIVAFSKNSIHPHNLGRSNGKIMGFGKTLDRS
ncbi:hypothetical protein [Chamaesiphon minutus]|uniref:Uncharacterized protein n=1 Tax=Chamaesiphon minutus (strain ATCC 27169 / PCC 6605) TaxID=1173020 RepID=K9UJF8_CHAP6|nr:hypothetical protein [Chamaesiphon minutus]AFY94319.1 hypothetical protein Cha6605_3316 [Chamaesiphon minutus PCC 6605]